MTLAGMVWWTACFALLLWRCRQQIRALRASVEAPKPGPYDEPLPRCKCSQRGDPVEVEVHAVYDRTTHTGKGADPCGPGCEKYTTRVVCSKCWLTATNATPQPEWPPDVYPRPVPWRDTLPPVDATASRLAALRDLLRTKREAIDRLANALSMDTYGGTVVSVTEHTAYQALHAEAVDIRREIVTAERADWEARGLCSECGLSKANGHAHADAVTGERADKVIALAEVVALGPEMRIGDMVIRPDGITYQHHPPLPWGDAKSFQNAVAAMKAPLLCTEPEYEDRYKHGEPEPVRCVCANCGRTPYEHGEVVAVHDPQTGELLGAVRRGDDGETHLA